MANVFEVKDVSKRIIRLTKEQWAHIVKEHPGINNFEELKDTLVSPVKLVQSKYDPEAVCYYYTFKKETKRFLMVAVKYLNGEGFIITSYYVRNIK